MDFVTNALNGLVRLQKEIDALAGRPAGGSAFGLSGSGVYPPINVFRDNNGLVIRAELPGLAPSAINVSLERRRLTISGERVPEEARGGYHRRERAVGKFSRSVTLPEDLEVGQATAHWQNGVLTLRVPPVEAVKPRQITIQAA